MKTFLVVAVVAVALSEGLPQYTFSSGGGRGHSGGGSRGRLQHRPSLGRCKIVSDVEYVDKYDTVCDTKYE